MIGNPIQRHRCIGTRLENGWNWLCLFCAYEFTALDNGELMRVSHGDVAAEHFGGVGGLEITELSIATQ